MARMVLCSRPIRGETVFKALLGGAVVSTAIRHEKAEGHPNRGNGDYE